MYIFNKLKLFTLKKNLRLKCNLPIIQVKKMSKMILVGNLRKIKRLSSFLAALHIRMKISNQKFH